MKNFTILFAICTIFSFRASAQSCKWLTQIGGTGYDNFGGMATDPQGNLVVAGTIGGNLSMFFSKINSAGIPVWTKKPQGNAQPAAVAVSDSGYIYIAGIFQGYPLVFDGDTLVRTNYADAFIVKLDQNGNVIWGRASCGYNTGSGGANPTSIAVNTQGEVYVCGEFWSDTVCFGNVMLQNAYLGTPQGQTPSRDMFLVKYSAGGYPLWGRAAGGNYYNADGVWPAALTLDACNNIFITGGFACTSLTFDSHTIHLADSTNRSGDMFLVKYSDKGKAVWAISAGGCCGAYGNAVTTDGSGHIYVAGASESPSISFGPYTLVNPLGTNTWYGSKYPADFLVKYFPNGKAAWANRFETSYISSATGLGVDKRQNVYVTGYAHDANSANNLVLAEYDSNAVALLKKHASGNDDYARALALTKTDEIYIGGNYSYYTFTFDSCSANPMGSADIFILKLKEEGASAIAETVSEEVALYPNPSEGLLKLELDAEGESHIRVVDVLGKVVYTATSAKRVTEINLVSAAKGVYFLLVEAGHRSIVRNIILR